MLAMAICASASCGMLAAPSLRAPTSRLPAGACNAIRMGSLFAEPTAEEVALERRYAARESRLELVAERFGLDPDTDGFQIAARAASSLPEEENGTWGDVAFGIARNACVLGLLLTGLGALPSPSSAADCGELGAQAAALCNQAVQEEGLTAEGLDVLAIFVVPFGLGALLVALAASQYENLIDKLSGDGDGDGVNGR